MTVVGGAAHDSFHDRMASRPIQAVDAGAQGVLRAREHHLARGERLHRRHSWARADVPAPRPSRRSTSWPRLRRRAGTSISSTLAKSSERRWRRGHERLFTVAVETFTLLEATGQAVRGWAYRFGEQQLKAHGPGHPPRARLGEEVDDRLGEAGVAERFDVVAYERLERGAGDCFDEGLGAHGQGVGLAGEQ